MKRTSALIVLSLLVWQPAIAQQDSVTVAYHEEAADSSDFSLKEKYDYFTRATVEEKSMFKVGISELGYGGYYGLFLEHAFAYERKINVPFSVLAQYRNGMSGWQSNHLGLDLAVRYYYSLPRRIRQGKSANNLSANYFSVQNSNQWFGNSSYVNGRRVDSKTHFNNGFSVLYGLQRRLGKYGYIDVNAGCGYFSLRKSPDYRTPLFLDLNFSIGFAF